MPKYTEYWKKLLKEVGNEVDVLIPFEKNIPANEILALSNSQEDPSKPRKDPNGRLITWAGSVWDHTKSAIFKNLSDVIEADNNFKNKFPGELTIRIASGSELSLVYEPITFERLIQTYWSQRNVAYKDGVSWIKGELYKWELIQSFQEGWDKYSNGEVGFQEFFSKVNFKNLIYPTCVSVFNHVLKEKPLEFERLLNYLYDESKSLKQRISTYTEGFKQLYFSLPDHGKNTFQEERTIATLLTFRYPENYTLFKDTFYSKLSRALGTKPKAPGEKIFHYYEIVDDFIRSALSKHPEVIEWKNEKLNENCYKDNNNLILAQDILYMTLDKSEASEIPEEINLEINNFSKITHMASLNTILYGPPGTGKTYHTINKAIEIVNPDFDLKNKTRQEIKAEYTRLEKAGHIEFCTFHQSMSYEDFIEGIKPVKPAAGDTYLKYEIKDGIMKRLAKQAAYVPEPQTKVFSISEQEFAKAQFYKMSLGDSKDPADDAIFQYCMDNGYLALGWGDNIDFTGKSESDITKMATNKEIDKYGGQAVNYFIHYIKKDNYVIISNGNQFLRAIGRVTGDYEYKGDSPIRYYQFRKVEWLLKDVNIPVDELYRKGFSQASIYQLDKKQIKKDFFVKAAAQPIPSSTTKPKKYVLIIDEINRGNVSSIFGELITLIEDDKRAGRNEALEILLPYSGEKFSIPANLHIIGTMNTADRSVEALDTALRRRFSFQEMLPDSTLLLKGDGTEKKVSGISLKGLLDAINERIAYLLDDDHKIGHSYFYDIAEDDVAGLMAAFSNKIIPLLKEYFYNDYERILLVLGSEFVSEQKKKPVFAGKKQSDIDKTVFVIKNITDPIAFINAVKMTLNAS